MGEAGVSFPCTLRDPRQPLPHDEAVKTLRGKQGEPLGWCPGGDEEGEVHEIKWGLLCATIHLLVPSHPGHLSPMGQSIALFSSSTHPGSNSLCAQFTLMCQCLYFFFFPQSKGRQCNILSLDAALKGHPVGTLDFRWGHFQLIQTNRALSTHLLKKSIHFPFVVEANFITSEEILERPQKYSVKCANYSSGPAHR